MNECVIYHSPGMTLQRSNEVCPASWYTIDSIHGAAVPPADYTEYFIFYVSASRIDDVYHGQIEERLVYSKFI